VWVPLAPRLPYPTSRGRDQPALGSAWRQSTCFRLPTASMKQIPAGKDQIGRGRVKIAGGRGQDPHSAWSEIKRSTAATPPKRSTRCVLECKKTSTTGQNDPPKSFTGTRSPRRGTASIPWVKAARGPLAWPPTVPRGPRLRGARAPARAKPLAAGGWDLVCLVNGSPVVLPLPGQSSRIQRLGGRKTSARRRRSSSATTSVSRKARLSEIGLSQKRLGGDPEPPRDSDRPGNNGSGGRRNMARHPGGWISKSPRNRRQGGGRTYGRFIEGGLRTLQGTMAPGKAVDWRPGRRDQRRGGRANWSQKVSAFTRVRSIPMSGRPPVGGPVASTLPKPRQHIRPGADLKACRRTDDGPHRGHGAPAFPTVPILGPQRRRTVFNGGGLGLKMTERCRTGRKRLGLIRSFPSSIAARQKPARLEPRASETGCSDSDGPGVSTVGLE